MSHSNALEQRRDSVGCLLSDAARAWLEWRLELLRGHSPGASPAFVAEYDPEVAHVL